MLTWQIDRMFRSGPLCALVTFAIPAALAMLVHAQRNTENVLGIMLVASLIIFVGSATGSALASGFGIALFGLGTIVADVHAITMLIVGVGLYATMVLHDLAGAFHRAPRINPAIWKKAAVQIVSIGIVAAALFAVASTIGGLATWQTVVVPFGIAAIGFAAKLAADAHLASARRLTAKRRSAQPE